MPRDRIRMLIWLGGAAAALLLLAGSLPSLTFDPGHVYDLSRLRAVFAPGGPTRAIDPVSAAFWQRVMAVVMLGMLVILGIALIISPELRRELLRRFLIAMAAVLLFYILFGLLQTLPGESPPAPVTSAATPPPANVEPFPEFTAQPSSWLTLLISLVLAAMIIAAVWIAWRRARAPRAPLAQLADEAQAAVAGLQAGADLKDTVLRCYREMSRILAEGRGVERASSMTAREFERALATAGVRDDHVRQLTRLFERVRYGARQASARDEREALDCLTAIAEHYGSAR